MLRINPFDYVAHVIDYQQLDLTLFRHHEEIGSLLPRVRTVLLSTGEFIDEPSLTNEAVEGVLTAMVKQVADLATARIALPQAVCHSYPVYSRLKVFFHKREPCIPSQVSEVFYAALLPILNDLGCKAHLEKELLTLQLRDFVVRYFVMPKRQSSLPHLSGECAARKDAPDHSVSIMHNGTLSSFKISKCHPNVFSTHSLGIEPRYLSKSTAVGIEKCVNFMYTGVVEMKNTDEIEQVHHSAAFLGIKHLSLKCQDLQTSCLMRPRL